VPHHSATGYCVRPARLPEDIPFLRSFILALQTFEHAFEPDRRLDEAVADEYFVQLHDAVMRRNGCIFVATDDGGRQVGWAVVHEEDNDIYVEAEERLYGYISELFIQEDWRGRGVGRTLIDSCEAWGRARGLKVMMIGVLPGNTRASRLYDSSGYTPYAVMRRKYL
jgi:GNAT superfamily N-acetyltransferase